MVRSELAGAEPAFHKMSMNRLIPGFALALGWVLLLLYGSSQVFLGIIVLIVGIGAIEYAKMAFPDKGVPFSVFLALMVLQPALFLAFFPFVGLTAGLVFSFFLLIAYVLSSYSTLDDPLLFLGKAFFGIGYVGVLGAHLLLLYQLPQGSHWILVLTAITAGSDSGAYYFGRSMGRRKLCPLVSPNKTVEGAFGGLVAGMMAAAFMAMLLRMDVNWLLLLSAAAVLTGVGIVGDLTESIIKRATGTKDSGTLLAGHGGVLDRVDSLLFAAPALYYLLRIYQMGGCR